MTSSQRLAIVLPAYNEEAGIAAAIEVALAAPKWLPEGVELGRVIVVNDGSVDGTGDILGRLAQENSMLRIVTHQRCQGLGAALRSGFAAAKEDVIVYTDADQPIALEDLRPAITDVASGAADLLAAFRLNPGDTGLKRRTLTKAYAVIARLMLDPPCHARGSSGVLLSELWGLRR